MWLNDYNKKYVTCHVAAAWLPTRTHETLAQIWFNEGFKIRTRRSETEHVTTRSRRFPPTTSNLNGEETLRLLALYGASWKPSQHHSLTHCWWNVGPPSLTLAQHCTNIGSVYPVCWNELLSSTWQAVTLNNLSGLQTRAIKMPHGRLPPTCTVCVYLWCIHNYDVLLTKGKFIACQAYFKIDINQYNK